MLLPKALDDRLKHILESKGYVRLRGTDGDRLALARRAALLAKNPVDLVLDVGANEGQYGATMRKLGYSGRIHSFEPMECAWLCLQEKLADDPCWKATQVALADRVGRATLHVAGNSVSSSLLGMLETHETSAPNSRFIRDEGVDLNTLDSVLPQIRAGASNIWLKLDVQGFESKVLAGAVKSLSAINFIQIELSLIELYRGQTTYLEMCRSLNDFGFHMIGVEPGFTDSTTGQLLQFDGIFRRIR